MWELPGEYVDQAEDPAAAAAREVEEETGWRPSQRPELVMTFQPMIGNGDALQDLYYAAGAEHVGRPDQNETNRIAWVALDDAEKMIARGDLETATARRKGTPKGRSGTQHGAGEGVLTVTGQLGGVVVDLGFLVGAGEGGAGEGNRTLMTSLEGWGSAIELRPRARRETCFAAGEHRQRTGNRAAQPNPLSELPSRPARQPTGSGLPVTDGGMGGRAGR